MRWKFAVLGLNSEMYRKVRRRAKLVVDKSSGGVWSGKSVVGTFYRLDFSTCCTLFKWPLHVTAMRLHEAEELRWLRRLRRLEVNCSLESRTNGGHSREIEKGTWSKPGAFHLFGCGDRI